MNFLKLLFRRTPRRGEEVRRVVNEAIQIINESTNEEDQRYMAEQIEQVIEDLARAAPTEFSYIRLQAQFVAVAGSISLLVWDRFGQKISQERCISLAQGFSILELYNQQQRLAPGNEIRHWFDKAIGEQILAIQASTPLSLCFMEQTGQAKQMVGKSLEIAKQASDDKILQAMEKTTAIVTGMRNKTGSNPF